MFPCLLFQYVTKLTNCLSYDQNVIENNENIMIRFDIG